MPGNFYCLPRPVRIIGVCHQPANKRNWHKKSSWSEHKRNSQSSLERLFETGGHFCNNRLPGCVVFYEKLATGFRVPCKYAVGGFFSGWNHCYHDWFNKYKLSGD